MCDRKHFDILRERVTKALADASQAGLASAIVVETNIVVEANR